MIYIELLRVSFDKREKIIIFFFPASTWCLFLYKTALDCEDYITALIALRLIELELKFAHGSTCHWHVASLPELSAVVDWEIAKNSVFQ